MQETESKYPKVWQELRKGYCSVSKSNVPFTSIGPEHAIEHENRRLKVNGGITGITQNADALQRFFTISPMLTDLVSDFESRFGIADRAKENKHHESSGRKSKRIDENVAKLRNVLSSHCDPILIQTTDLHNLMTQKVMDPTITHDIMKRDEIGQKSFESFVSERLNNGKLSVWAPMKKIKLGTFKKDNAIRSVRVREKTIKVTEERDLLQRFIIVARSRELDLKECIGRFEFGAIPRALFAGDGSLVLPNDKAKVAHVLESFTLEMVKEELEKEPRNAKEDADPLARKYLYNGLEEQEKEEGTHNVLLIDGMAVVQSMKKTDKIKTCKDLAETFVDIIGKMSVGYDGIRLIFDTYKEASLKEQTRSKRTENKSTYYHIKDSTHILHITFKDLFSSIRTKSELTQYLAEYIITRSKKASKLGVKKLFVSYGTVTKGNTPVDTSLATHSHEEADTLLILHALRVNKSANLFIESPDTDVLLLMVYFYPSLPKCSFFIKKGGKLKTFLRVSAIHKALGIKRANAILGFHAFTGCDMTGRFSGRSKERSMKEFLKCDDKMLEALSCLGESTAIGNQETEDNLLRYLCKLYNSKKEEKSVEDFRWKLYSSSSLQGENLPPTRGAMRPHYKTLIWKCSKYSEPDIPSPLDFGWENDTKSNSFKAIPCFELPAPEAILELVKCACKSGCKGNCSCRKNGLECPDACMCTEECTNLPKMTMVESDSDSD